MYLEDLLKEYKELFKKGIKEGDIIEIKNNQYSLPVYVVVIGIDEEFADMIPLSFQWELATKYDLIVNFTHPLRDKWIVQTDLSHTIPAYILYQGEKIGKLNQEDLKILKKALYDNVELPENRKGIEYNDEIHKKFKEFENERHEFITNTLFI